MNRSGDRIHSIVFGYGRLLLPWFGGWFALSERYELRFARSAEFHNCRATGIY